MNSTILKISLKGALLVVTAALIAGCDQSEEPLEDVYDNSAEVEAFYRDNPGRFVFSTLDNLPGNLDWQDGAGLTPIGDPRAKRGGHLKLRLGSMQQTLRMLGPDANGTLRGPLWSANSVSLIARHPWEDGYVPGLARQWAVDPEDGRTVYFRLDPDARWSDGKPVTVDDFFFSFYFLLSEHLNEPAISRVYDENYERITRYDDETFSITPAKASPDPLLAAGVSAHAPCSLRYLRSA